MNVENKKYALEPFYLFQKRACFPLNNKIFVYTKQTTVWFEVDLLYNPV